MSDMLNTVERDECCNKRWQKAANTGALDTAESWECPKCGTVWKPSIIEKTIRHWEPEQTAQVIQLRG